MGFGASNKGEAIEKGLQEEKKKLRSSTACIEYSVAGDYKFCCFSKSHCKT